MRADYKWSGPEPQQPAKRPGPISVLGIAVRYQDMVKINTRGSNIEKGKFELVVRGNRSFGEVSQMGEVIVSLTSHAVSVSIW